MTMTFRSLAKSVLTLQPGYSLRALNNKFADGSDGPGVVRPAGVRPAHVAGTGPGAFRAVGRRLHWRGAVALYQQCWSAPQRLEAVASHYEVVAAHCAPLLMLRRDERRQLCDLSAYASGCSLVLDRPIWFQREGELVVNLFQGDLRVASLAFTLCREAAGLCLYIGAVQGIHKGVDSDTSLTIYRELTKSFEGLRPRSLLIEAIKCVARTVGPGVSTRWGPIPPPSPPLFWCRKARGPGGQLRCHLAGKWRRAIGPRGLLQHSLAPHNARQRTLQRRNGPCIAGAMRCWMTCLARYRPPWPAARCRRPGQTWSSRKRTQIRGSMRIAYFINQYPKVSHSFIRREILALERQGIEVQRITCGLGCRIARP